MVILRIRQLDLDQQVDHVATDWQVSDTMNFSNILCESIQNVKNKRSMIFNKELDPNVRYYARARALLTTGYTEWGNLDIFTVDNTVSLNGNEDMPSQIAIPIIRTKNEVGYIEAGAHDTTLFDIEVMGYSVVGNATLDSTSYWIEDIYGTVIWSSIYNTVNKNRITVQDVILKANSVYVIKAVFHSTSNDASQIASYTIQTNGGSGVEVLTYLDNVNPAVDNEIEVSPLDDVKKIKYEILSFGYNYAQSVWYTTKTVDKFKAVIPRDTLEYSTNYILKVTVEFNDENINIGSKYIPFTTRSLAYSGGEDIFPDGGDNGDGNGDGSGGNGDGGTGGDSGQQPDVSIEGSGIILDSDTTFDSDVIISDGDMIYGDSGDEPTDTVDTQVTEETEVSGIEDELNAN